MLLGGVVEVDMDAFGAHREGTGRIGAKVLQLGLGVIVAIPHVNGWKIIIIMIK